MHKENNTSTVTESFLARWLVESYGLRGYGSWKWHNNEVIYFSLLHIFSAGKEPKIPIHS